MLGDVPDGSHALRASDADREAAVGRLRVAAMEGRLDAEELAERVSQAYDSRWCHELEQLTEDVTPVAPAPSSVAPALGPRVYVPRTTRVNGWAVGALVAGLAWMVWFGSVAAIVMGHVALGQIKRSGGRQTGKGLAIAGIVLGWLAIATFVFAGLGAVIANH
jgi:hypothetical protein